MEEKLQESELETKSYEPILRPLRVHFCLSFPGGDSSPPVLSLKKKKLLSKLLATLPLLFAVPPLFILTQALPTAGALEFTSSWCSPPPPNSIRI